MGERVTKKFRQGPVEIDYEESALVVNYEVEKVAVDDNGRVIEVISTKAEVRRVKLKALSMDKDMSQLAQDIIDKCSYIHPSRVEEVEQHLIKLRKHQLKRQADDEKRSASGNERSSRDRSDRSSRDKDRSDRDRERERDQIDRERSSKHQNDNNMPTSILQLGSENNSNINSSSSSNSKNKEREDELVRKRRKQERDAEEELPPAHIDDIDDYLDMLYQVGGKSDNAKDAAIKIQVKGTGMILNLCRNIMNLEILIQNSTVMGALTRVLTEEFKKSTELTFNILRIFLSFSNFMEMHALLAQYRVGMLTIKVIEYEVKRWISKDDEKLEKDMKYENIIKKAVETGDETAAYERIKKLKENDNVKSRVSYKKQERTLFIAFYLLLNIAEDITVEKKMINKNLLQYLEIMLERSDGNLLTLIVTFIKKLSIYNENKDLIGRSNIISKLGRFIPCSNTPLVQMTLQLLFNLSFDKRLREQMVTNGLVIKCRSLLKTSIYRGKTLKLLYHLSVDDLCKQIIGEGDGIPLIMGLVVNFPNPILAKELVALTINLSHNSKWK